MACETLVTTGLAFIAGEITTKTYVDFPAIVRETIREIGYTRAKFGFEPLRSKPKLGASLWFVVWDQNRNSRLNHEPLMFLLCFHKNCT